MGKINECPRAATNYIEGINKNTNNNVPEQMPVSNTLVEHSITGVLNRLFEPGQIVELRTLDTLINESYRPVICSGYYDDFSKLELQALELSGSTLGVYFTLNTLNPALLARAENRLMKIDGKQPLTSDRDIIRRRFLLVDVDANRPAGISSNDAEHEAALEKAQIIRELLAVSFDWPEPVYADSGNGAHLLYRIDLPMADGGLVERVLAALAHMFNDGICDVDQSVFNPARICKLYGTMACKGDSTEDRPHRVARVIDIPDKLEIVSIDKLEKLAAVSPSPDRNKNRQRNTTRQVNQSSSSSFDVQAFLDRHDIVYREPKDWPCDSGKATKWVLETCPWDSSHTGGSAYIIQFANGAISAGCHHTSCSDKKWRDLKAMYEPNNNGASGGSNVSSNGNNLVKLHGPDEYSIGDDGSTMITRMEKYGYKSYLLANFHAFITDDTIVDDGAEEKRTFNISAHIAENNITLAVESNDFHKMNWIGRLGANAVVEPGRSVADQLRAGIQILSIEAGITERRIFAHTGWLNINGVEYYLHASGAIGADGCVENIQTQLQVPLNRYDLPAPPDECTLKTAAESLVNFIRVAPSRITAPLLGHVFRAVLSETDFTLLLAGESGSKKTECATLQLQFFGPSFNSRILPGSMSGTGNSLESKAFTLKDTVFVIDDFAPQGDRYHATRQQADAERLIRAQGNKSARSRLNSECMARPERPPRGSITITAEELPLGSSIRARMFVLGFEKNDVVNEHLSQAQRDAADGLYASLMAALIQWLAPVRQAKLASLQKYKHEYRDSKNYNDAHARTADIVADLKFGYCLLTDFLEDNNLVSQEEMLFLLDAMNGIDEAAIQQTEWQSPMDPAEQYRNLLTSALEAGMCHVADYCDPSGPPHDFAEMLGWRRLTKADNNSRKPTCEMRPSLNRVGYLDTTNKILYLDTQASLAAAKQMGERSGDTLTTSSTMLGKQLKTKGWLVQTENECHISVKRKIADSRHRFYAVKADVFLGVIDGRTLNISPQPDTA